MIRVLIEKDGAVQEGGAELATEGQVRWVDVEAQTPAEVEWLGKTFGFHALALEDCLHVGQRPKLEAYPEAIFVVLHTFSWKGDDPSELNAHEIHFFLGENTLVSVHADPMDPVQEVWRRAHDPRLLGRGAAVVFHEVCDAIVDAEHPVITAIHDEIDELEEAVLGKLAPDVMERVFVVKRAILRLRRTLAPAREVLLLLSKRAGERVGELALYFRDVYDHAQRNGDLLESARERVNDAIEAYHGTATMQTNDVLKRLALFSAIFLPLTAISGFFGMNFAHLPFDEDRLLIAAVASMVLVPVAMVVWFRWSRWV